MNDIIYLKSNKINCNFRKLDVHKYDYKRDKHDETIRLTI